MAGLRNLCDSLRKHNTEYNIRSNIQRDAPADTQDNEDLRVFANTTFAASP